MANLKNRYSVIAGFLVLFLLAIGLIFYVSVELSRDRNARDRIERS